MPGCVALFCALPVAGCQLWSANETASSAGPAIVPVTLTEYHFEYESGIPGGRVVFELANHGRVDHQMRLFGLAEDTPPIEEQIRGSERRIVTPIASVPVLRPGERASVAVDLVGGRRYAFLCFMRDQSGEVHSLMGMNSEFRAE